MAKLGGVRGMPQRGREARYDPSCGKPYTPNTPFRAEAGVRLVRIANDNDISVSELLTQLVLRVEVDERGRLPWIGEVRPPRSDSQELPLTG